jgi:hypothetical protein
LYTLQAIEVTRAAVLPRAAIEWGYRHLQQGEKLGRLVAEYYFIYQDNRIKNLHARTPKERCDAIAYVRSLGEAEPGETRRLPFALKSLLLAFRIGSIRSICPLK